MVNHGRVESERAEVLDTIRHVQFYNYIQRRDAGFLKMEIVCFNRFQKISFDDGQKLSVTGFVK